MSKIAIKGNESGTATFTIESPATNTDRIFELPDEAGKILTDVGVPTSAMPAGSVIQVVEGVTTTEVVHVSDGAFVETTLNASITPTSASSKILILISQNNFVLRTSVTGSLRYKLRVLRGATSIRDWVEALGQPIFDATRRYGTSSFFSMLDSPNTASSVTYKTQGQIATVGGGRTLIFQSNNTPSTITLLEIAA